MYDHDREQDNIKKSPTPKFGNIDPNYLGDLQIEMKVRKFGITLTTLGEVINAFGFRKTIRRYLV